MLRSGGLLRWLSPLGMSYYALGKLGSPGLLGLRDSFLEPSRDHGWGRLKALFVGVL